MSLGFTYSDTMAPGVAGALADMSHRNLISRVAEETIQFGQPLMQGDEDDQGVKIFDGSKPFVFGVSVLEVSATNDEWVRGESVRILHESGLIWVTAEVAVVPGDPVHATPAGTFSNTGGTEFGAWWEDTAAAGELARFRIRGGQ